MTHPGKASHTASYRYCRENHEKQVENEVLDEMIEHEAPTSEEEIFITYLFCHLPPRLVRILCSLSKIRMQAINLVQRMTFLQILRRGAHLPIGLVIEVKVIRGLFLHPLLFLLLIISLVVLTGLALLSRLRHYGWFLLWRLILLLLFFFLFRFLLLLRELLSFESA